MFLRTKPAVEAIMPGSTSVSGASCEFFASAAQFRHLKPDLCKISKSLRFNYLSYIQSFQKAARFPENLLL